MVCFFLFEAIISGKWFGPRPYVCNGPLTGTYVFAQLHFHWGPDDEQGSEHTLDGQKLPLEMHVIFFNSIYMTQDDAKNKKDGIIVFSYFFKLQAEDNENLSPIVNSLRLIRQPFKSEHLELMPLMELVYPFEDDYFLYWGNVSGKESQHPVLWLLCRHPYLISSGQVATGSFILLMNYRNAITK
ncbi:hypothetical protein AAG570_010542 [Ranatra chinensis]|uniref:Alpha-carbonic anhydrase domain-containing protein n=1 Tax=Ranatra chinensis TaxID=642074 RepID=A0ABD0YMV3_9HEMI